MTFSSIELMKCLKDDVGAQPPYITSDMTIAEVRTCILQESLLKKLEPAIPDKERSYGAVRLFLKMNEHCASVKYDECDYRHAVLLHARSYIRTLFRPINERNEEYNLFNLTDAAVYGRTGPGASIGTDGNDAYRKLYYGPMSMSNPDLYKIYAMSLKGREYAAESFRTATFSDTIVSGNKLGTVAKNEKIDRTIGTEPSLEMLFQLGIGELIKRMLWVGFKIDLSVQPEINRLLAQKGSLDGSIATIDSTSASDTNSLQLCELLLPPDFNQMLLRTRSKTTTISGFGEYDGEHTLNMMSSMGNGFTFALMTLVFAAITRSAMILNKHKFVCQGEDRNFGVFGDDVICPTKAYRDVTQALTYAGFIINLDKSYSAGPFRESCGGDFFNGHLVRGVYLKRMNHVQDYFSAFNRLARWINFSGVSLDRSLCYIGGLAKFQPVPPSSGDTEGHIVSLQQAEPYITRKRIRGIELHPQYSDTNTSDFNVACYNNPETTWVKTYYSCVGPHSWLIKYYRSMPRVSRYVIPREGLTDNDDGIEHNFDGAVVLTLRGYVRNNALSLRIKEETAFQILRSEIPSWDDWQQVAPEEVQDTFLGRKLKELPKLTVQELNTVLAPYISTTRS